MLTLTKVYYETLGITLLNRLFTEAFSYISKERQRAGEDVVKNELTGKNDNPFIRYDLDGYTVGVCNYTEITYNGMRYLYHKYPVYGQTQAGSRSWWYSEEFQEKNSEFVRSEGFVGMITLFNPESPAGIAVGSHIGSFGKYYNVPTIIEPEDAKILLNPSAAGKMKAYVIDLMD